MQFLGRLAIQCLEFVGGLEAAGGIFPANVAHGFFRFLGAARADSAFRRADGSVGRLRAMDSAIWASRAIKLSVAAADDLQVSPLKGDEFGTKSCQLQLGLGKLRTEGFPVLFACAGVPPPPGNETRKFPDRSWNLGVAARLA